MTVNQTCSTFCSSCFHVIGVYLLSQSASRKHNHKNKAHKPLRTSYLSPKMCLPCLIIIKSCYFDIRMDKPFPCSRCVICVSGSVLLISTFYVRKGSWAFFLITHKSTRSENPMPWLMVACAYQREGQPYKTENELTKDR